MMNSKREKSMTKRAKLTEEERAERQREAKRKWYAAHRKKSAEEVHAARVAAGKRAAAVRWGGAGEKTVQVQAYESDAERLKWLAPRTADAIRGLLEGAARRPPGETAPD